MPHGPYLAVIDRISPKLTHASSNTDAEVDTPDIRV